MPHFKPLILCRAPALIPRCLLPEVSSNGQSWVTARWIRNSPFFTFIKGKRAKAPISDLFSDSDTPGIVQRLSTKLPQSHTALPKGTIHKSLFPVSSTLPPQCCTDSSKRAAPVAFDLLQCATGALLFFGYPPGSAMSANIPHLES